MKRLWVEKRKFIESEELKSLCKELKKEYTGTLHYLLTRKYLIRIFKGFFYVRSIEEIKFDKLDKSPLDLIANGLRLKGITNWYFGLYTALKLNNFTHEYFTVNYLINDKIFRAKDVKIAGFKFKFIKIRPSLIFGIKEKNNIRFSDVEKTILDFIYLDKYRSVPEDKIILDISGFMEKANKDKLFKYLKNYPKSVRKIVEKLERKNLILHF
jgi:predicted transcriptional regulator of viral defense system